MSEQTATLQPSKQRQHVPAFEIEWGYGDRWVSSFSGRMRFRGKWSRLHLNGLEGSNTKLAAMPDIPGLRMKIIPKDNRVVIHDPLEKQPELLQRITAVYKSAFLGFDRGFTYVKSTDQVLDQDRFKTLLLELRRMLDSRDDSFELVSGELPTLDQIESLPGRELMDPAGDGFYKIKYKDDEDRHETLLRALAEKGIVI